jgi:hypothetical protein
MMVYTLKNLGCYGAPSRVKVYSGIVGEAGSRAAAGCHKVNIAGAVIIHAFKDNP